MKEEEDYDVEIILTQHCDSICHGCLNSDRLSILGENQDLFHCLLGQDFAIDLSMVLLCWKCQAVLGETRRLQQRIQRNYLHKTIHVSISRSRISPLDPDSTELVVIDKPEQDMDGQKKETASLRHRFVFEKDDCGLKDLHEVNIDVENEYDIKYDLEQTNVNSSIKYDIQQTNVNSLSIEEVSSDNTETEFLLTNDNSSADKQELEIKHTVGFGLGALHNVTVNENTAEDETEGAATVHVGDAGEEEQHILVAKDKLEKTKVRIKHQTKKKKPEVQQHINIPKSSVNVNNEQGYKCRNCDKIFLQSYYVHTPRWYKCEVCKKKEKPYQCKVCGQRFMNLQPFKNHVYNHSILYKVDRPEFHELEDLRRRKSKKLDYCGVKIHCL